MRYIKLYESFESKYEPDILLQKKHKLEDMMSTMNDILLELYHDHNLNSIVNYSVGGFGNRSYFYINICERGSTSFSNRKYFKFIIVSDILKRIKDYLNSIVVNMSYRDITIFTNIKVLDIHLRNIYGSIEDKLITFNDNDNNIQANEMNFRIVIEWI